MATPEGPRAQLEDERARLRAELEARHRAEGASSGRDGRSYVAHHIADDATETFDRERGEALERHVRGVLDQVERALHKVVLGDYGRCDRCGGAIGAERLAALQSATLCLPCQARSEERR